MLHRLKEFFIVMLLKQPPCMATLNLDAYTDRDKNISRVLLLAKVQHSMLHISVILIYILLFSRDFVKNLNICR